MEARPRLAGRALSARGTSIAKVGRRLDDTCPSDFHTRSQRAYPCQRLTASNLPDEYDGEIAAGSTAVRPDKDREHRDWLSSSDVARVKWREIRPGGKFFNP
jgi:hypothetical protein